MEFKNDGDVEKHLLIRQRFDGEHHVGHRLAERYILTPIRFVVRVQDPEANLVVHLSFAPSKTANGRQHLARIHPVVLWNAVPAPLAPADPVIVITVKLEMKRTVEISGILPL